MSRDRFHHHVDGVSPIATVLFSGGQDSTTCLGLALDKYGPTNVRCVSIHYGQRHARELRAAEDVIGYFEEAYSDPSVGQVLSIPHEIINLGPIFAGTSPLTNSAETLETYTSAEEMEATIGDRVEKTFVPMRNAVFLMLAANRAVCAGSRVLITGVCEADNANYPDCRGSFVLAAQGAINEALGYDAEEAAYQFGNGEPSSAAEVFRLEAPLLFMSKADSIRLALDTPHTYAALAYSHTAYDGAYPPTGKDHASVLRADGFEKAGVPDPLVMRAWTDRLLELPATENYAGIASHYGRARGGIGLPNWTPEKFVYARRIGAN